MKATGIVRRIDDLGRVVIPKEIRKTLRIREGDPLEIFTDREGEVILKKYSSIGELSEFAAHYAESLFKTSGYATCITDKDSIIAVSGVPKKEFLQKPISEELDKVIREKATVFAKNADESTIPITREEDDNKKYTAQLVYPIISEGDSIGSVIMVSQDPGIKMGDTETKLIQTAVGFLGKHTEPQ